MAPISGSDITPAGKWPKLVHCPRETRNSNMASVGFLFASSGAACRLSRRQPDADLMAGLSERTSLPCARGLLSHRPVHGYGDRLQTCCKCGLDLQLDS